MGCAFGMLYTTRIGLEVGSQPPVPRGKGYPCTSRSKLLKTNSYKHEENTYHVPRFE